jgi:hypothetical protein
MGVSMSDVKIFVSHRIDKDTPIVARNPLYVPVRCGAVYDRRKAADIPYGIVGDDTGDNISKKRLSYSEFTVQYWAWKNIDADYYGLHHYRRYLSFSPQNYPLEEQGRFVAAEAMDEESFRRYCLDDSEAMCATIEHYDAIVNRPADVCEMDAQGIRSKSVYAHWALVFGCWTGRPLFREEKFLQTMLKAINERFPQYARAASEYLEGSEHRGHNCFVMRRELFQQMCELQFGIMAVIEASHDLSVYPASCKRIGRLPAYIGEILFGIFVHYLKTQDSYRIKENQLVFFEHIGKAVRANNAALLEGSARSKSGLKGSIKKLLPSFRAAHRLENRLKLIETREKAIVANLKKTQAKCQEIEAATARAIDASCTASAVQEIHNASFAEFEGCNKGREVVVLASGPTLKHYVSRAGAVHIGMNLTVVYEKVKLDYYFLQDWEHEPDYQEQIIAADCVKFFGRYCRPEIAAKHEIPDAFARKTNARRYFSDFPSKVIRQDLTRYPLMDFSSVVFPAMHFALYTQPERIYLVGCDVSKDGYYCDNIEQVIYEDRPDMRDILTDGYLRLRDFARRFHPNTEIVSINPVGLRGIFRDIYQGSAHDDAVNVNKEKETE